MPKVEIKEKQYTCGKKACQKKRRERNGRRWRRKNPSFQAGHRFDPQYQKAHAKWKRGYRIKHPEYVLKNWIYVKSSKLKGKSIESRE